jgi:hypothetical protein
MLKPDLICVQETKIEEMSPSIIRNAFGPEYESSFEALPADGAMGGIVLATIVSILQISSSALTSHTILPRSLITAIIDLG